MTMISITPIPTIGSFGPNGTFCLPLASFKEFNLVSDTYLLTTACFILGIILGAVLMYYRIKWEREYDNS